MDLHNQRKMAVLKAMDSIDRINKEISKREKITLERVKFLLPEEIEDLLLRNKKINVKTVDHRRKECIIVCNRENSFFQQAKIL